MLTQVTGNTQLDFFYDDLGNALGFIRNSTDKYYYIRNLQNDVVGILDSGGTQVVEYVYDTWGKLESVTGAMAETIGRENPLRYRGYYYDEETGFYYLQSRYYDPETGRFLNADETVLTGQGITSGNMYAYCGNNPVMNYDPSGNCFIPTIVKVAVTVLVAAAVAAFQNSIKMLAQGFTGNGEKQKYNSNSTVANRLKKSTTMNNEIESQVNKIRQTGQNNVKYYKQGSTKLYDKKSISDLDLAYSAGKVNYIMIIERDTKTIGSREYSRYITKVIVWDKYDFAHWSGDSLSTRINNWGYDMQEKGYLTPYRWDCQYTVEGEWE